MDMSTIRDVRQRLVKWRDNRQQIIKSIEDIFAGRDRLTIPEAEAALSDGLALAGDLRTLAGRIEAEVERLQGHVRRYRE